MTVALRAAGTATSATAAVTAVNPAVPSGATTGDLSILAVWAKPYSATITTPAGWTKIAEATNGTTATGTDTGSTKVAVYVKVGAAVGAIGNIGQSGANSMGAVINTYSKDGAKFWDFTTTTSGGDTSNGSNFSATGAGGLGVTTGDWVVACAGINSDGGTPSAITIAGMSGATRGTVSTRTSAAVTTGNDTRGIVADVPITAGSSSAAPTFTYTNSSSTSGSVIWLRLREVDAHDPFAAYAFDEGSGTTAADSSGNDYSLTLGSGTWGTGHTGTGLAPLSTYPADRAFGSGTLTAYTIMAWIRLNAAPTTYLHLFSTDDSATTSFFTCGLTDTGALYIAANEGDFYSESTATIPATTWKHVAFVVSDQAWTYYIDGVASGSENVGLSPTNLTRSVLWSVAGQGDDPTATFAGVVDDFRIFAAALGPDEIAHWRDTAVTPGGGEGIIYPVTGTLSAVSTTISTPIFKGASNANISAITTVIGGPISHQEIGATTAIMTTTSGDVASYNEITGNTSIVSITVGSSYSYQEINAVDVIATTTLGSTVFKGQAQGTQSLVSEINGDVSVVSGSITYPITGNIPITTETNASPSTRRVVLGSVSIQSQISGAVSVTGVPIWDIAGTVVLTSVTSATVVQHTALTGTVPVATTISGTITARSIITSLVSVLSGIIGNTNIISAVAGSSASTATISGTIRIFGSVGLPQTMTLHAQVSSVNINGSSTQIVFSEDERSIVLQARYNEITLEAH